MIDLNFCIEYKLRLASVFILGASLFFTGCSEKEQLKEPVVSLFAPSIDSSKNNTNVLVNGVFGLEYLNETDFSELLSVFVIEDNSSWNINSSPILGSYSYFSNEGVLKFTPKYPFLENSEYYVRFDYSSIIDSPIYLEQPDKKFILEHTFTINKNKTPVTFVEEVYPSTSEIPRNLLKFYIQFSESMSEGEMLENVRILDENDTVVEHAFLEIPQELWDVHRQRLTILFDPGRIKRGMELLNEVGAPFEVGKKYTLQIDKDWKDGQHRELTSGFEKTFVVIEDDRTKPETHDLKISIPPGESFIPLELDFKESMDFALLNRVIKVQNHQGHIMSGEILLTQKESIWKFIPVGKWKSGIYSIQISPILEDLAGNNYTSVFDVDLQRDSVNKSESEIINLSFEIE